MALPGTDGPADDGGMIDLDEFERLEAEQRAQNPEQPEDPDALPSITDERRRELKDQARKMIEERLRAKRKQRRLMRGGDLG